MNMHENKIHEGLREVMLEYSELNRRLRLDTDDEVKFDFADNESLIRTLCACKNVITKTLKVFIRMYHNTDEELDYSCTRDLYKRADIHVTYAIIYHDLKNVFTIIDIADSSKSNTITRENISRENMEDVYVTMVSFILQTMKVYEAMFNVGGGKRRGRPRKSRAVAR